MLAKYSMILLVAFCALLGAIGQIFFKLASKSFRFDFIALITIFSIVFLGEPFVLYKWLGILLIICGITVISI